MKKYFLITLIALMAGASTPREEEVMVRKIYDAALTKSMCYGNLRQLCKEVGHRLTGSRGDTMAVLWAQRKMKEMGYENIRLQPFEANYWVRGTESKATLISEKAPMKLSCLSLGGSIGTGPGGVTAEVVEVDSWDVMEADDNKYEGKIVFYNRPMNPKNINTFQSYGECVDQRWKGASEASKRGAVAAVVRSMSLADDHHPHTGSMEYADSIKHIPSVAIGTKDADVLHNMLRQFPNLQLKLVTDCKNAGKVITNNVMGEIKGSEFPEKVIVIGAHLDSWDVGEGAHDDGAGCAQALEILNIFREIGYKPRHTVRCVLYMNEENGAEGGQHYAREAKKSKEKHIAAIESDGGGFSPRGFHADGIDGKGEYGFEKLNSWRSILEPYNLHYFAKAYAGTDIGPLRHDGTVIFGLVPDSQRYFDLHHTEVDVFEAVNKRELELGAASMAALVYLIDRDRLSNN